MLADNWCRFVLNEGIMPASLVRFFKQSDTTRANTKLLAQILKTRENFSDSLYPELTALAKRSFLSDEELNNWLSSMDSILTIIITFADGDNNTQDILNGALTSFIKSCPLVADDIKNPYMNTPIPSTTVTRQARTYRRANYDNPTLAAKKDAFINYLMNKGYSAPTCNSYKTSVNLGKDYAEKDLWEIENPKEIKDILYKLMDGVPTTEEERKLRKAFEGKNLDTHNALSNGLKRYYEFLENRESKE